MRQIVDGDKIIIVQPRTIASLGAGIVGILGGTYLPVRLMQEVFWKDVIVRYKAKNAQFAIWSLIIALAANIVFTIAIWTYTSAINYESCAIKPRRSALNKESVYADNEFTCYDYNQRLKKEKPDDYE
jgi:hypothetical protein